MDSTLKRHIDHIFYCDNTSNYLEYKKIVERICTACGVKCVCYCGLVTEIRTSSIVSEFVKDLYDADTVVVNLGKAQTNWVFDLYNSISAPVQVFLIYREPDPSLFEGDLFAKLKQAIK